MNFRQFLQTFKSGWGAVTAVVTAGPLALFAADLAPPWPNASGSAAATVAVVAGIVGLVLAHLGGVRSQGWRKRSARALMAALVALLAYVACWSLLVVRLDQIVEGDRQEQILVIGFWALPSEQPVPPERRIREDGIENAYSRPSLLVGRLALLSSWAVLFLLLTYGFGLHQMREKPDEDSPDEDAPAEPANPVNGVDSAPSV